MDEKSIKRKKKTRNLVIDLATLFVVAAIAIFLVVFFTHQTTTTTTTGEDLVITGLSCKKDNTENPYFQKPAPISSSSEVSATFRGENLQAIMYSFTGRFEPGANINQIHTRVHADFDLDYGNAYVHRDSVWSESFADLDLDNDGSLDTVKLNVYSESAHLSASVSHVFGLTANNPFPKTLASVRSAYTGLGYTCEVKD